MVPTNAICLRSVKSNAVVRWFHIGGPTVPMSAYGYGEGIAGYTGVENGDADTRFPFHDYRWRNGDVGKFPFLVF